ncbi:hypothetical protein [Spirosoma luteum]|uniref:hypothetical protein n=1 Tax=Spirosoma luteum TaxID=431553 RepID=UPI00035D780F|nr:hypothetical protein [Spirosoma luteum]
MVPTFLLKRQTYGHSLRVYIAMVALVFLMIGYTLAVSWIIAERTLTKANKLVLIGGVLITALLTSGLFRRLSR